MSLAITQFNSALKAPLVRAFFKVDIPGLSRESLLVEETTVPSEPLLETSIFINGTEVKVPVRPQMGGDWEFTIPEGIFGEGYNNFIKLLITMFSPFFQGSSKLERSSILQKIKVGSPDLQDIGEGGSGLTQEDALELKGVPIINKEPISIGITPIPLTLDEVAYYYTHSLTKEFTGDPQWADTVTQIMGGSDLLRKIPVFGGIYDKITKLLQPIRVTLNDWYIKELKPIQVSASDVTSVKLSVSVHYNYLDYVVY